MRVIVKSIHDITKDEIREVYENVAHALIVKNTGEELRLSSGGHNLIYLNEDSIQSFALTFKAKK